MKNLQGKMEEMQPKAVKAWKFIQTLRMEPFLFLFAFQMGMRGTPGHQMMQDKICMQKFNMSSTYCFNLPETYENGSGPGQYKISILSETTKFATYHIYLHTPFSIFWALFIGAWIDRYTKARKLLMVLFCLAKLIEDVLVIYLSIRWDTHFIANLFINLPAVILVGGATGPIIAMSHYVTATTAPKMLAIRLTIYHTCFTLGIPIGRAVGGYIFDREPFFQYGEIRNYTMVFIFALLIELTAFLWVVFMVKDKIAVKQEMKIEMKIREAQEKGGQDMVKIKLRSDMKKNDEKIHPIKLLFDLQNVRESIRTVAKSRPNKARMQIFFLIISMTIIIGEHNGLHIISYSFIQRVYLWRPDYISYMGSLSMLVTSIGTLTVVPLMTKVFNVADIRMAWYGFCNNLITNIIRGSWLTANAYYVTMAIGAIGDTASICIRSHISKIVDRDEMGKLLSFMHVLEQVAPFLATALIYVFRLTIDSYPGAVYHVIAGLVVAPIFLLLWIDFFTERPMVEGEGHKNAHCEKHQIDNVKDNCEIKSEIKPGHHKQLSIVIEEKIENNNGYERSDDTLTRKRSIVPE